MSSLNKFNDLNSPLIINMGTQNIKYSQPILSTYKLSKTIINKKESEEEIGKIKEEEKIINANTIFDFEGSMKIKPTLNFLENTEIDEKETIEIDFSLETEDLQNDSFTLLNEKDKIKFSFEPFYNGNLLKKGEIESFGNILKKIGKLEYGEQKFENEKYSQTPLIISLDPLSNEEMYDQVSKIYSYCFEKLNASYILICSQAMLNLFSHNLLNGIVVDIGESNTTIIPVKNGFACYDKSVKSNFLSGRTITALMNKIDNDNNLLSFSDYKKYDNLKTNDNFEIWNLNKQFFDDDKDKFNHLNYLFFYPELFRGLFRRELSFSNNDIKNFLKNGILADKSLEKKHINFISMDEILRDNKIIKSSEFENLLNSFYNNKNSLEKVLNEYNGNYIEKEELIKFRQFSLSQRIISKLEDYVNEDPSNGIKYSNIIFTGGVLNTKGIKEVIKNDFETLFLNSKINLLFPQCKDARFSMFKGANYISKLDNLESIMISRQEYFEIGEENLCYNYI